MCCWCIDVATVTDGYEKCILKLCVYKTQTPFGKSGHKYTVLKLKDIVYIFVIVIVTVIFKGRGDGENFLIYK